MPEAPPNLIGQAHAAVASVLNEGMQAIDATVGNGHDTLFLARQVGATGHVYGFDVQQAALDATAARLRAEGVADRASLIHAGHETMARQLPATLRGKVQAIMFNLGYLPGSDRGCITRATSTLPALEQSLALLAPQGVLSLLACRRTGRGGHRDPLAAGPGRRALQGAPFRQRDREPDGPGTEPGVPVSRLIGRPAARQGAQDRAYSPA
jgi:SAM-dependent methyltransferase